ncbi:hypothetical protein L506_0985, partial [Bordetella bronchiseptica GA96-01]
LAVRAKGAMPGGPFELAVDAPAYYADTDFRCGKLVRIFKRKM